MILSLRTTDDDTPLAPESIVTQTMNQRRVVCIIVYFSIGRRIPMTTGQAVIDVVKKILFADLERDHIVL